MSYIKTKEAAARLGITSAQVTRLCRASELVGIDVSERLGVGRPTYRICLDSIEAFERRRQMGVKPTPKPKTRRRPRPPVIKEYV